MMVLVPWSISILFKQTAKCQDDLISKAKEEKKKKSSFIFRELCLFQEEEKYETWWGWMGKGDGN